MSEKPAKRSSLFLLELIIAILFFSLASAVCIRFFVKSHILSQDTNNLNMAVNQVSGCAELFLAKEDAISSLKEYTYLDKNWTICTPDEAAFVLHISFIEEDMFQLGTFTVTKADSHDIIYTIDVRKYTGVGSRKQVIQ